MKKRVKNEVNGNLAIKESTYTQDYDSAVKESILSNATNGDGVKYATIPVAMLRVDPYQRPIQKKVLAIAEHWDASKAGTIEVSYRDGEFWIMDGQNRAEAAKLAGVSVLHCVVSFGLTREEEIFHFAYQDDGVTKVSIYDKCNAIDKATDLSQLPKEKAEMAMLV